MNIDKLVIEAIFNACKNIGDIFYLGPGFGAFMLVSFGAYIYTTICPSNAKRVKNDN
ncbi:MAG: hypothetical protein ACRC7N_10595 [Clostridium sp.]